jgi:hypothetical protein
VILGLISVGFFIAGFTRLSAQHSGTRTTAKVTACGHNRRGQFGPKCLGFWVEGGSLALGNGHVVSGVVDGANSGDVGKTIDVRVSGGRAYAASERLAIVLLAVGGVFAVSALGKVLIRLYRQKRSERRGS